jgi:hypothetical protein
MEQNKDKNKVTKRIMKNLKPQDQEKMVAQEKPVAEEESKKGLSETFTSALTNFIPLAVGGLFEGSEGAVAAYKGAQEGMNQLQTRDIKERQMSLAERQQGINKGLATERMDLQREQLNDPLRLRRIENEEERIKIAKEAQALRDKQLGLNKQGEERRGEQFEFSKQEKAQLSGKQQETVASLNTVMNQTERINDLVKNVDIGPLTGRKQSVEQYFGSASPEFTKLKSNLKSLLANYTKALSGAQVSEQEAQRLMQIIPSENDPIETFIPKLQAFQEMISTQQTDFMDSIRSGQPLKRSVIDKMLGKAPKQPKKEITETQAKLQRLEELRAKKAGR